MKLFIGCDAHKSYSEFAIMDDQFAIMDKRSQVVQRAKVIHGKGAIKAYLQRFAEGTDFALETVGNYYWIFDEDQIEEGGCNPFLAHAGKAEVKS